MGRRGYTFEKEGVHFREIGGIIFEKMILITKRGIYLGSRRYTLEKEGVYLLTSRCFAKRGDINLGSRGYTFEKEGVSFEKGQFLQGVYTHA